METLGRVVGINKTMNLNIRVGGGNETYSFRVVQVGAKAMTEDA